MKHKSARRSFKKRMYLNKKKSTKRNNKRSCNNKTRKNMKGG
jgi:hypothetical protein